MVCPLLFFALLFFVGCQQIIKLYWCAQCHVMRANIKLTGAERPSWAPG